MSQKTDKLVKELRDFHHFEAARTLESAIRQLEEQIDGRANA